tara:strand:- start:705 stop:3065 length:2361 start_codon:yes stop_codon:yes gene_type:complete
MATVPLTPSEGLEIGSAPQFSSGRIEPIQDTVTDDLQNFAKAQQNVSAIAFKLQDEFNDAESKKLYNEFYNELEASTNNYLTTKGFDAVKTVNKEEGTSAFDEVNNNNNQLLAKYAELASNGESKYLFENMASVSLNSATNKMTEHSIKQQRLAHESEVDASIENHKKETKNNYASWNDSNGAFVLHYAAGLEKLKEKAILKGWNIDPEATDANGQKIGISEQYIKDINEYNMEIYKDLLDKLGDDAEWGQIDQLFERLNPILKKEEVSNLKKEVNKKHIEHNAEVIAESVIQNNGNQNSGNFLDQANKLFSLSSNNAVTNDNGGAVVDGFNTNDELIDLTNSKRSERIELLQQVRDTSIFYQEGSTKTLIPEHQTTHLFAIQKLNVKKADSLYTRAYNSVKFDKEQYKNDDKYRQKINEKILDKYNELIIANVRRKYFLFDGTYADKVNNDLEVIKKGIDYNVETQNVVEDINPVTNLRPLDVLKEELKETITDKNELEVATKNLEIKYNKTKNKREAVYNQAFNNAKEIAFAEEGGWKNLKANNIDINNFTEEDQQILKNGRPIESDVDTEFELKSNPAEVATNLEFHSHKLSNGQYLELKRYAASLRSEDSVIEATGNVTMLKATLDRYDMGDLYTSKNKEKKRKYIAIHDAWLKEINALQITKGNVKLTMGEKQQALNNILLDNVNVDNDPFLGFIGGKDTIDTNIFFVDQDQLQDVYVEIPYKGENVKIFISKIDPDVLSLIKESLRKAGKPVTQKNIADYFVRKGQPANTNEAFTYTEDD